MQRDYKVDPGFYAAATYTNGAVLEAALKQIGGKIEDKDALMKTLRGIKVDETCRGPVQFDKYGNVVGNIYIRKVEKKGSALVNSGDQDLSECEPVLDLRRGRVPEEAGLQSRELAGEQEFGAVDLAYALILRPLAQARRLEDGRSAELVAILRDARLRTSAPQDEVGVSWRNAAVAPAQT